MRLSIQTQNRHWVVGEKLLYRARATGRFGFSAEITWEQREEIMAVKADFAAFPSDLTVSKNPGITEVEKKRQKQDKQGTSDVSHRD